ncbi:Na+/H+ antiporter subunit A [Granulicoccus phenolivorans]|uniref:Na+/H+ antiporter subunit A n=1 Tax=Granulicoccus phenolivorans TaxID=266854 RepID=UPI000424E16F|nr:Na+/H+ antiporter subunit A [Granulicoccus phenolivorans]
MLIWLLIHFLAAVCAPLLVKVLGRKAFWLLALPSAGTAVWALLNIGWTQTPHEERYPVVPSINAALDFRIDSLSWVFTLVVSVVGAAVLAYCAGYFSNKETDLYRFAAHLTGFAGVMLGLVWADNLLGLYTFWEITTVLSYLLVGHLSEKAESRAAAMQALVVTTFGGLAMLAGMIMLGHASGTYRVSEILAHPPAPNVYIGVALALMLVGALTKSAQVPFHFWLPGAMAAPTPVSAYLHAAAMVKAGIYLIARFAPTFADYDPWRWMVFAFGGLTMLIGGYRAMRQTDLKLILAFGTVSQLGFLVILVGGGTADFALAGITLVVTHAIFKSGLFLSVGAIDHATGTRDIRRLNGLGRKMPVLAVASTLCAASMAGIPPLLGFVSKEAAYTAMWNSDHPWQPVMLVVIVAGSVLTFAYSARFVWGAWATKDPAAERTETHPNPPVVVAPTVLMAALSVLFAYPSPLFEPVVRPWTSGMPSSEHPVHLGLWHGLTPALGLSALTIALGVVLFVFKRQVFSIQAALPDLPRAAQGYRLIMRSLDRLSLESTGLFSRGSLPMTLTTVLAVFVLFPGSAVAAAYLHLPELKVVIWDHPAQALVGIVMVAAAIGAIRARRRFRGVFLVGVTGYGTALLFLLHGAPDLALTQVLVETVSVVVFVLVLRRFSSRFRDQYSLIGRGWRLGVGILSGAVFAAAVMLAPQLRVAPPDSTSLPVSAYQFGGGLNIVNVILVDTRAWDTMGEISVVLVAATGVASLIFLRQATFSDLLQRIRQTRDVDLTAPGRWISSAKVVPDERRSLMFEVVTRLIFHAIQVWSVYLLLTGHNAPGGGFAAGLVAGLGLTVRYLAGGAAELRAAMPVMPGTLLGIGLFLSAGVGLVSMLAGGAVLQSWTFDIPVPLIGNVHLVSSTFFDIGVYLVVIGLILDILRSLGANIDGQIARAPVGSQLGLGARR